MDQLNVAGNERIDLADFQFATNTSPAGLVNEVTQSFISTAGAQNSIVSGFAPSIITGPLAVQIGDNITPNVAFLGQRIGGSVANGVLCAAGTASQSVGLSTFAAGTYYLYVRFTRNPGTAQQRVYWDGTNSREYPQLTNTRNLAQFEVRVESAPPSGEWLQIATIVVTVSGGTSSATITDQRPMYFEGTYANNYSPTWGTSADRVSNRLTKPIPDLRTMIDALKAAIVDIKGNGLASWYTNNVQGLNVGPNLGGANPTANRINVGDTNLNLRYTSSGGVTTWALQLGLTASIQSSYTPFPAGTQLVETTGLVIQSPVISVGDNTNPIKRIYPDCQVFAAGIVFTDGTKRTSGATVTSVTIASGVYTITFSGGAPTNCYVLTQPVSTDTSAVGYSSYGVLDASNRLIIRMSRGNATVSTTPTACYFCIINGP